jgi:hypothetical protein
LGENTSEVLRLMLKLDDNAIDDLIDRKIIEGA